jgi:catechol 2,3-dioxygenase-like lactoylglutathione lyase family enzyme
MKITGSNVTVMITDMDRAIKFYESIGLSVKQRWDDFYAILEAPGVTIGLHPGKQPGSANPDMSIGFMIDKAAEGRDLLNKLKVPFREGGDDGDSGVIMSFQDPDGNWLYFNEPAWK